MRGRRRVGGLRRAPYRVDEAAGEFLHLAPLGLLSLGLAGGTPGRVPVGQASAVALASSFVATFASPGNAWTLDGVHEDGVPDPNRGETVKSFIVKKPGAAVTEEEILAHCKKELAAYKVPKFIEFVDALPMTTTGKLQRGELRRAETTLVADKTGGALCASGFFVGQA